MKSTHHAQSPPQRVRAPTEIALKKSTVNKEYKFDGEIVGGRGERAQQATRRGAAATAETGEDKGSGGGRIRLWLGLEFK